MKKQLQILITLLGLSLIILNPCSSNAQEYWWAKWQKNIFNPVVQYGPDSWFYHATNASVILDDGTYKMWFTGFGGIDDYRRIGYAESTNGTTWDIYHEEPVLSATVLGSHTYIGSVLKINDTLKMWYSGQESLILPGKIGYAWSLDGYVWNEHHEAVLNPGPAGSWDNNAVYFPCVIYDGTSYHMYYGNTMGIGYATSPNGIDWIKDTVHSPIHWISPGTFYDFAMFPSGAILYNDTVHMWFAGRGGYPKVDRIGYGYSTDFYSFTWYDDTAMNPGPSYWDGGHVQSPYILEINGKYRMWYGGTNLSANMFKIGAAELPVPSCVPVYFTGCENGDGFDDFILNEIQNTGSGCESLNGTGWSEYHDLGPAKVIPGETYTLTISSNNNMQYATVWVDWNRNEEFEDDERVINNFIMEEAGTSYELDFVIPQELDSLGLYNMRAKTNCNTHCDDPCENYFFGETEDYLLYYPPPPPGIHELQHLELGITPNPITSSTTLSYTLEKPTTITINIFNPQGQLIEKIEQEQPRGKQQVKWNAEGLTAGMYYFRIKAGDKVGGGKMVLLK